jgi:hypothetical protein
MRFTGRDTTDQGVFDFLECEHCGLRTTVHAARLRTVSLPHLPCQKCGMSGKPSPIVRGNLTVERLEQ